MTEQIKDHEAIRAKSPEMKVLLQIRNLLIALCEKNDIPIVTSNACNPDDPNCDPNNGPPPGGGG